MALFQIYNNFEEIKNLPFKNGFAYFTPIDGKFYIDAEYEEDGIVKQERININPSGKTNQRIVPITSEYKDETLIIKEET